MSIHVTVKNDDSRESAVIGVTIQHTNTDGTVCGGMPEKELKGGPNGTGESTQLLVHSTQQILIREIRQ